MKTQDGVLLLGSTTAFCSRCEKAEMARILAVDGVVFMDRLCPEGVARVKIASNLKWYLERSESPWEKEPRLKGYPSCKGCPYDCGLCENHASGMRLPVLSITNDCNLDCPICFTHNRKDEKYYKSPEETETIIKKLVSGSGSLEIINLTGGEPTLHPRLLDLINVCKSFNIGKITMNTNGLEIARNPVLASKIKESGIHLVLSLDTFDPEKSRVIHGKDISSEKKVALERIESLNIPVTILTVCIKGVNEEDTADIVKNFLPKPFVKSITIQNMTFTGKNGGGFKPRDHITIDEVESLLESRSGLSRTDFFSMGSYHPLCYSAAYYIVYKNRLVSLTDLMERSVLTGSTRHSYTLDAVDGLGRHFKEGIDRLWMQGCDDELLSLLKAFLKELFPEGRGMSAEERKQAAEKYLKMVLIHQHMDEDNFDLGRLSRCGDLVPDESGKMIPACSYNLIYRKRDPRFWVEVSG